MDLVIPLRAPYPGDNGRHLHPGLVPWRAAVCASSDPCLLLDGGTRIVAVSAAASHLLHLESDVDSIRPGFLESGLIFLDFTAAANPLIDSELGRLAPVQALQTDVLERGLIRLDQGRVHRTFDVAASPLHSPPQLDAIGALVFLTPVGPH